MNAKQEAREFKDQAFEYFKNDVVNLGWSGDFTEHLRKYGLYQKLREYAFEEKWSREELAEFTAQVITEIKKDYLQEVAEILRKEKIEFEADSESVDYYVNKEYLMDHTVLPDEDLSDEAVQSYIQTYREQTKRSELIINTLQKILDQLRDGNNDQ